MMGPALDVTQAYQQALGSLDRLPPFSPVLQKLLATLSNEDVSYHVLAKLIEKDTVLTSYVLRLVNSVAYGQRGRVTSVGRAVSILGLIKLRNTLLSLSITQLWSRLRLPASWSANRFNLHGVATAVFADLLAQHVQVEYPEGAFVGGLLHDLGKLLIAVGCADLSDRLAKATREGADVGQLEYDELGATHADLSAAALARWNLPTPIQVAVRDHHRPDYGDVDLSAAGTLPLGHLIAIADREVNRLGLTALLIASAEVPEPPSPVYALVKRQFDSEIATLLDFFGGAGSGFKGTSGTRKT